MCTSPPSAAYLRSKLSDELTFHRETMPVPHKHVQDFVESADVVHSHCGVTAGKPPSSTKVLVSQHFGTEHLFLSGEVFDVVDYKATDRHVRPDFQNKVDPPEGWRTTKRYNKRRLIVRS